MSDWQNIEEKSVDLPTLARMRNLIHSLREALEVQIANDKQKVEQIREAIAKSKTGGSL